MQASYIPKTSRWNPDAIQAEAINQTTTSVTPPTHVDAAQAYLAQCAAPASRPKHSNRRFFGIPKRNTTAFPNVDDYELKYPEDAYGEEMGPTARVWRMYLDEAQKADSELVEGWRDTTDVLLVFAGLFSAVVATFVVQMSTHLQPDYTQITAFLLLEQNALLRATASHISVDTIPPSTFSPNSGFPISKHDRWVNGLWFTSLSVSLVVAFMAVLVKQWVQHYVSVVSGTPHDQVRIRQFRFLGVERWHMPLIIGTLPILLHLALLLYFAGLVLFLWPLDGLIAYVTLAIAILAYGFYTVSNILPLWYPICPYKTPLSSLLAALMSSLRTIFLTPISALRPHYRTVMNWVRTTFHARPLDDTSDDEEEEDIEDHPLTRRALYHMKESEGRAASKQGDEVDAEALVWLYSTSSNPTVVSVTVQAISGLRFGVLKPVRDILKKVVTFQVGSVEDVLLRNMDYGNRYGRQADDRPKVERLLRACHQLGATITYWSPWNETCDMMHKASGPNAQIMHACNSMLACYSVLAVGLVDWQRAAESPLSCLDSYDYTNGGPTPFMWSVLLRRCQHERIDNQLKRWLHGMRVMHNYVMHNYPSISDSSATLQHGMFLEYICSLSRGSDHDTDWGEFSVLAGLSAFRVEKVLPQIYSALSEALRVVCASCTSEIEPEPGSKDIQLQLALPRVLHCSLSFLTNTLNDNVDPPDQEKIATAAATLQVELQKLVEWASFWKNEEWSQQRSLLCDQLHHSRYWPPWMSHWKISWTPELMDYFLHSYDRWREWADLSFSEVSLDVYRIFEEKDGLSKVNRGMHRRWFRVGYLAGLIRWKTDQDDREPHIDYLFSSKSFPRIVKNFIIEKQEDGTYKTLDKDDSPEIVGKLFRLRSPDHYPDIYGEYLPTFRELMKDHPDLWSPIPKPVSAEPEAANAENKARWKQLLSAGEGVLSRWIPCRVKRGRQDISRRGADAA